LIEWNGLLFLQFFQSLGFIRLGLIGFVFALLRHLSPSCSTVAHNGHFKPGRGLRQGDPLSPFLFILGSEVISRLLLRQESRGLLSGIKIAKNCTPISHLLFADDLILFARATSAEANSLNSVLQQYCGWSGQSINFNKSSIHFSKNTAHLVIQSISGIFPFTKALTSSKYLGLPLFFGKSKTSDFKDIVEKVSGKIEGWRAKTLSQAGRFVLIRSVASSIPSYAMSSFLLPIAVSSSLDKAFKNLWWGFPMGKTRNLSLKSWSSICSPRVEGGLGFKRMHEFNLSLVAKLGWQLLNDSDCLWVKQLQNKYIKYGDFLSSPPPTTASWLWKGIQKIKPIIAAGACLRVFRNSSSPIWTSNWVPTLPTFRPQPKHPYNRNLPSLQIRDLIDPIRSSWKAAPIHALFDPLSATEILKTCISMDTGAGFLWTPSTGGISLLHQHTDL
jgi:hypothetical protein